MIKKAIIEFIVGKSIVAVCFVFIGVSLLEVIKQGGFTWNADVLWLISVGGSAYSFSLLVIVLAWYYLLKNCGESSATFSKCYFIYSKSQIAKYLPGNVFHYAGRHVLGRGECWSNNAMITALFLETGGLIVASLSIVSIGLIVNVNFLSTNSYRFYKTILIILSGSGMLLLLMPLVRAKLIRVNFENKFLDSCKQIFFNIKCNKYSVIVYMLYVLFFIFNGFLLYLTFFLRFLDVFQLSQAFYFIGVLSLAWLIGFITPGAPGGLGVREAVMITALSQTLTKINSLELALLFRGFTITGDLFLYISSYLIDKIKNREQNTLK